MGDPFSFVSRVVNIVRDEVVAPVQVLVERQVEIVKDKVVAPVKHLEEVLKQEKALQSLQGRYGCNFPGDNYVIPDLKNWISGLNPEKVHLNEIVWPGTHNSGTNSNQIEKMEVKVITEMFTGAYTQCQDHSIYDQLLLGTRLLDIRVNENKEVCHARFTTYSIDVVINDVKKFLSETKSEIIILEIRTEFGHNDPPEFDEYLKQHLGDYLIRQDEQVFLKPVSEILPKRIICVWKPKISYPSNAGNLLWNSQYLRDDWINTDLPYTKFLGNLENLSKQEPVSSRKYFYRIENTVTHQGPQLDNPLGKLKPVTDRIHQYARLFISQCVLKNIADRLQVFSIDFINEDFVRACVCLTRERILEREA